MNAPFSRILRADPLTSEAFAPYGEVLSVAGRHGMPVNDGRALRFDGLAHLSHDTQAALPVLSLYQVAASPMPASVDLFERHPDSGQVFLPMAGGAFLVVVAPDVDGAPDPGGACAFLPPPGTGIHYRPGIWHVPMTAIGAGALFAMLMWEGAGPVTVEHRLSRPLLVQA